MSYLFTASICQGKDPSQPRNFTLEVISQGLISNSLKIIMYFLCT